MSSSRLPARALIIGAVLLASCTVPQPSAQPESRASLAPAEIEVAFSPEAGSEALVLKVIDTAQRELRLTGYTFPSPAVVKALMDAKRRGVDVQVLVDDRGNHGRSSVAALGLLVGANIPARTIAVYAIHHDKYIVVDSKTTETGSFNYSQAAAHSNSENVLVLWDNPPVAAAYLAHWQDRWARSVPVTPSAR